MAPAMFSSRASTSRCFCQPFRQKAPGLSKQCAPSNNGRKFSLAASHDGERSPVMFTAQFQDVLQEALSRSGEDSLFGNSSKEDANATPAAIEVLYATLSQSRIQLSHLLTQASEIQTAVEREQKQIERLEYILDSIQQDYAYFAVVEKRMKQQQQQNGY